MAYYPYEYTDIPFSEIDYVYVSRSVNNICPIFLSSDFAKI